VVIACKDLLLCRLAVETISYLLNGPALALQRFFDELFGNQPQLAFFRNFVRCEDSNPQSVTFTLIGCLPPGAAATPPVAGV